MKRVWQSCFQNECFWVGSAEDESRASKNAEQFRFRWAHENLEITIRQCNQFS